MLANLGRQARLLSKSDLLTFDIRLSMLFRHDPENASKRSNRCATNVLWGLPGRIRASARAVTSSMYACVLRGVIARRVVTIQPRACARRKSRSRLPPNEARLPVLADQSARWHATICPGATCRGAGSSVRQRSNATGQRVWKRQPDGGARGLGTSPLSTVRCRAAPGSGTGTADSSARV